MDLEELNKTQIILLTLLVSFVSAIATSIFTVQILEQAPPAVTQTINRVVERTVERVVPAEVETPGSIETTVIEKETTVVVKEDDLITESIEKNKRTMVRFVTIVSEEVTETVGTTTTTIPQVTEFKGAGVIVSKSGLIASAETFGRIDGLHAILSNGEIYEVSLVKRDLETTVGLFQLVPRSEDEVISVTAVTFSDPSSLKLGQTVISLGGEARTSVAMGIISSLVDGATAESGSVLTEVDTNIMETVLGSPLVNIFGEIVGIDSNELDGAGVFVSSSLIQETLSSLEVLPETVENDIKEEGDTVEG